MSQMDDVIAAIADLTLPPAVRHAHGSGRAGTQTLAERAPIYSADR